MNKITLNTNHLVINALTAIKNKNYIEAKNLLEKEFKDLKNHLRTIIKLKKYCNKKNLKFFLSNDVKLAINLNLDGVYIPSFNKSFGHLSYSYNNNFKIIGSAHNLKEIKTKEMQKVSKIILSSLFKKNKNFLGLFRFKLLSKLTKKDVVALGGISRKNLKMLKILDNQEFAGISYFE